MRILYMGTPDFAKTVLDALVNSKYKDSLVGAVTQTDKPKNRGQQLTSSPVKVAATEYGIPVYQPVNLKNENFGEILKAINPDLIIVAAYGKILPKYVLDFPKFGCICVHGSLLPKYRGAAPIQRAIMAGEDNMGITIMKMDEGIDTGAMIKKGSVRINKSDNFGDVHDKLAKIGADNLLSVLDKIEEGNIRQTKQSETRASYAKKIEKEDCKIDFSADASAVRDMIRALSPYPLAYTILNGRIIKITKAALTGKTASGIAGSVASLDSKGEGVIVVNCGDKKLKILRLVPEGKKEMSAGDFIRGRQIKENDVFNS